MATTNVIINERNCPSPDVVDLLQQQEAIDTIVFSIYPFVRDDIDLSKYDCYVHIIAGEWGKEEKLPYITSGGYSMTITWALDDDVLKNGNLVSYVLIFKHSASGSSVWETEEGTILTKIGIPADENIAGYYVQKLRATKNVIASLLYDDFFCYKFMPLGAWIFPILRTAGRIYISSLSALSKCCAIEDSTGGGISISARSVSLNSPALLCAKNICDAMLLSDSKLRNGVPFCVNYGNLDNSGQPNIITTSGSSINFLVGGEYPLCRNERLGQRGSPGE